MGRVNAGIAQNMAKSSRRVFLQKAGAFAVGAVAIGSRAGAESIAEDLTTTRPATTRPNPATDSASIVVSLSNPLVMSGSKIHEPALQGMIQHGLRVALDRPNLEQPWRQIFRDQDIIGIKFDPVGWEELATSEVFATVLVRSLGQAGISPQHIMLLDAPPSLTQTLGTRAAPVGWQKEEVAIGSTHERLSRALSEVTALINVPFLKHDNITGLAGAIKNISLPFVRRQLPYYQNGGAPHLAHIAALPQIRSKLRVHIVNGLRGVFEGGPAAPREGTWLAGRVLVSTDMVAIDQICVDLLDERRQAAQLSPISDRQGRVAHVHAAAKLGLGTDDRDYIRLLQFQES